MKIHERANNAKRKLTAARRRLRENGMMKTPNWKVKIQEVKPDRVMSDKTTRRRARMEQKNGGVS